MFKFLFVFLLFLIYSIIGWIIDVICSYFENEEKKEFKNRGFLIGPYCPIYGFGSIFMLFLLNKFENNILILFIMSSLICTTIEYITSYIMEKLFKARWWNYGNLPFNINGRICLFNSILFGFLGIVLIKFLNPIIVYLLMLTNPILLTSISIVLLIIFIVDTVVSTIIIKNLKITSDNIEKDKTNEITLKVKKVLLQKLG